jgi:hypothetical protein
VIACDVLSAGRPGVGAGKVERVERSDASERRSVRSLGVGVVMVAAILGGCGDDEADGVTVPVPSASEQYAALFAIAWSADDRAAMEQLAPADVVDLALTEPGAAWGSMACDGAAGSTYCTFTEFDGEVLLVVRVGNEAVLTGSDQAVSEIRFD